MDIGRGQGYLLGHFSLHAHLDSVIDLSALSYVTTRDVGLISIQFLI